MADSPTERQRVQRDLKSLWNSYNDDCKSDKNLQDYDSALKSIFNNALEGGGPGGVLRTCEISIKALMFLNQNNLDKISSFKESIQNSKRKWSWKKPRRNEARVNLLADEYINNTQHLLAFVAEMEIFLKKCRNRCTYIRDETERYLQMKNPKNDRGSVSYPSIHDQCTGGSSSYSTVWEALKSLTSDGIWESSTESLHKRCKSLYENQESMIKRLTKKEEELGKKQDFTPWWRRAKNIFFMGTVSCMFIVSIVMLAIGAAPIAGAILTLLPSAIGAGHWSSSFLEKYKDSVNYKAELNDSMLQGTREAKKMLGNIEILNKKLGGEINALLLHPSSTKDEGQIDSTMKLIASNLGSIQKQIDELEKETKKFSVEIHKARDDVHIRRHRLCNINAHPLRTPYLA